MSDENNVETVGTSLEEAMQANVQEQAAEHASSVEEAQQEDATPSAAAVEEAAGPVVHHSVLLRLRKQGKDQSGHACPDP